MEFGSLSLFWLGTSALLVIVYFIEQHPSAPNFLRSLFRWGKMRAGFVTGSNHFYEVPKRWFQHFYIFACLTNCLVLVLLCRKLHGGEDWPTFLTDLLQLLQYPVGSTGLRDAAPVFLALTMELAQVGRRCWETHRVNVFSERATMTLLHYLLGFVFYLSISLCVLAGTDFHSLTLAGSVSAVDVVTYCVAVVIFLAASVLQHQSFRILAALRTTGKDSGPKKQGTYPLPRGGLFELVSCPHFLAEILVYFSLCVLFRFHNVPVLCLFVFVLVNQVLAGLLNHQWYCKNFPGVADRRRAVFPYLL